LGVEGLFGGGGEAGTDDAVALSALNVDDGEHVSVGGEADDDKSLFIGGTGVEIDGMGVLEGGGSFYERDSVFLEVGGGLVVIPFVVAENHRSHLVNMRSNTCAVKEGADHADIEAERYGELGAGAPAGLPRSPSARGWLSPDPARLSE
jgi:hypothetical protein